MNLFIIGPNGYIGSNLMAAFPTAIGIHRGEEWPDFKDDDVIINCVSYPWRSDPLHLEVAKFTNVGVPYRLLWADATIIHFTSTATHTMPDHPVWKFKKQGDDVLRGKAHIVYLPTVYGGINQHPHMFMTALLDHVKYGTPFTVETPEETRDFIHIDLVKHMVKSIISGTYNAVERPVYISSMNMTPMGLIAQLVIGVGKELLPP